MGKDFLKTIVETKKEEVKTAQKIIPEHQLRREVLPLSTRRQWNQYYR